MQAMITLIIGLVWKMLEQNAVTWLNHFDHLQDGLLGVIRMVKAVSGISEVEGILLETLG